MIEEKETKENSVLVYFTFNGRESPSSFVICFSVHLNNRIEQNGTLHGQVRYTAISCGIVGSWWTNRCVISLKLPAGGEQDSVKTLLIPTAVIVTAPKNSRRHLLEFVSRATDTRGESVNNWIMYWSLNSINLICLTSGSRIDWTLVLTNCRFFLVYLYLSIKTHRNNYSKDGDSTSIDCFSSILSFSFPLL